MKRIVFSLYVISFWIISGCSALKIESPKDSNEAHFIQLINFIPYSAEESSNESLLINQYSNEEFQQLQIELSTGGKFYHYLEDSLPIPDFHKLPFVYAIPSNSVTLSNKLFIKYSRNELIVIDPIGGKRKYHYSRLKAINSSRDSSFRYVIHGNAFQKNKKLKGVLFSTFFWDENNLLSRVHISDFIHLSILTAELKPIHLFLEKNQQNKIVRHLESIPEKVQITSWTSDSLFLKLDDIHLGLKLPEQVNLKSLSQSNFSVNGFRGIIHRL